MLRFYKVKHLLGLTYTKITAQSKIKYIVQKGNSKTSGNVVYRYWTAVQVGFLAKVNRASRVTCSS